MIEARIIIEDLRKANGVLREDNLHMASSLYGDPSPFSLASSSSDYDSDLDEDVSNTITP